MKAKAFTGIMLTLFLVATLFTAIPIKAQQQYINIAVVGPQGWIQWDGIWVGCVLARDLINDAGGIKIGATNYLIKLKAVDSHAVPEPEPAAGWAELLAALEPPFSADFVIGGFRTECVAPMRLNFLQYAKAKAATGKAPIWIIAGASTDELIDCDGTGACGGTCVRCNYDLGRYIFRVTPMCGTWLFKQIAAVLRGWILPLKLGPIYGGTVVGQDAGAGNVPVWANPVKAFVVAEDLTWTLSMGGALVGSDWVPWIPYPSPPSPYSVLGPNVQIVGYARSHALTPNFEPIFDDIDATGAHLIIHIYSAVTGIDFIKTWKERETDAVCVGINVESQMYEFYDKVGGKCEYESFLATVGTRTNLNPNAKPLDTAELWDLYKEKSGEILSAFWGSPMPSTCPIYTMWGAYDAIIAMNETLPLLGTWPASADALIAQFEATERTGVVGKFRYSDLVEGAGDGKGHDVYMTDEALSPSWTEGWVRSHIPQWQNGLLEVVWPRDQPFSRRYKVPPWMYSLAETDVAGAAGPPFGPNGIVYYEDMGFLAAAWLTKHGVTGWNIEVDMDNNGVINIFDAGRIAKDWNKQVSLPLP